MIYDRVVAIASTKNLPPSLPLSTHTQTNTDTNPPHQFNTSTRLACTLSSAHPSLCPPLWPELLKYLQRYVKLSELEVVKTMEMDRVARQHCGSASAGARCWAFAANNGGVDDVSGRTQRLGGATRRFVDADKPQRSWRHHFSSCSSETAAAGGVRWIKTSRPSRLQQQQQQLVVRTWLTATALGLAVLLAATAVTTLAASTDSESNQDKPVVTFVLVGATGNLVRAFLSPQATQLTHTILLSW